MSTPDIQELPSIAAEPSAPVAPRRENVKSIGLSLSVLLTSGFILLLLSGLISGAFTLIGKNQLMLWLGEQPKAAQPDKTAIAIEEMTSQLILFSQILDDMKLEQTRLKTAADNNDNGMVKLTQRVTNVERFTSELELRIVEQKKASQKQVVVQPKPKPVKPKAETIIPLVLISIRNQAGTPLVALRDGLENSELLMPGDTWRGWTLLEANQSAKTARFRVAGREEELRL